MEVGQGFAIRLDLGHRAWVAAEVVVDNGALIIVDRVERVDREQLFDFRRPTIAHDRPRLDTSVSVSVTFNDARSVRNPDLILLFTVPSGWSSCAATSR